MNEERAHGCKFSVVRAANDEPIVFRNGVATRAEEATMAPMREIARVIFFMAYTHCR